MKIVIFAGGVGTRLWPLSRKNSPKQFEKVIGDHSTLQLTVNRLLPAFSPPDIFISTNIQYRAIVQKQLSQIPADHIIGEPQMRDVGPAVGLMTAILMRQWPKTPIAILWSDHLVKEEAKFRKILKTCETIISKESDKVIFISQKPRFASQNLGWIEYGRTAVHKNGIQLHEFSGFKYRPDPKTAETFFKSGKHAWNLGYFVTTPRFLWEKYKQFVPEMYKQLTIIQKAWQTKDWDKTLQKIYPNLEKISFDNAILENLSKKEAYVVSDELGWSDIGAWEALKEALQRSPEDNVTRGKIIEKDTVDSLVYNYSQKQLLVTIDLQGVLVINTDDAVLVCKKESVPKIKKLVESFTGTEYERLS